MKMSEVMVITFPHDVVLAVMINIESSEVFTSFYKGIPDLVRDILILEFFNLIMCLMSYSLYYFAYPQTSFYLSNMFWYP